jgi:aminopeptidase N
VRRPGGAAGSAVVRLGYEGAFSRRDPDVGFYQARIGPDMAYGLTGSWYPELAGEEGRSRGSMSFLVPAGWTVAAVGRLVGESETPAGRRFDFAVSTPVGYSFAAGPFRSIRRRVDGIDMGVFLLGGEPGKPEFYLDQCARVIGFLRGYYGGFRGESFTLVEIPQEYLGSAGGGGWEEFVFFPPGVLPEGFFFAPAFGHEIGHMFWGGVDSADGPVISEGLAQVSMGLYLEKAHGEKALRTILKDGAPELLLAHSARLYFHSLQAPLAGAAGAALGTLGPGGDLPLGIPNPAKRNALHTLANSKGWFVFMMLRDLIGPDAFQAGLRGAMLRYAGKRLSLAGLRAEFETAAGRDLKWFFDQWFFRPGAPEYAFSSSVEPADGGWRVEARIRQTREIYRVAADVAFVSENARVVRRIEIADKETELAFLLPFRPDEVLFDLDYKILRWSEEFKE